LEDGSAVSTNALPEIEAGTEIPFNFIKNGASAFYIKAEGINNLLPSQEVYLTDLKTNVTQKLNDNPVYHFTSNEGDPEQRFKLHFGVLGTDETTSLKQFNIYGLNDKIIIRSGQPATGTINIYNISGQLLNTVKIQNQKETVISMNGFNGMAIVSVLTNKGVENQKVIIK